MQQIGLEALGIKAAEQVLAGKILAGGVQIAEHLATPKRAPGRGDAINETKAFGRTDHPLIETRQDRRVEHDHASVQLRMTQGCVIMQHTAE
jgi:hypothetical protein